MNFSPVDFSPTGWLAVYEHDDDVRTTLPVERWSYDGPALVVDSYMAVLVQVASVNPAYDDIEGYGEYRHLQRCRRIVTVMPAAPDWTVTIWQDDDGSSSKVTSGIAAWIVDDTGAFLPVVTSRDTCLRPIATDRRAQINPPLPPGHPER